MSQPQHALQHPETVRSSFPVRMVVSWEARAALVIVFVSAVLRLLALGGMSTDYDEGVYWQSLRAMAAGHPLFSSIFSSQPPLFLISEYPVYMLFGQTLAAARLGVALLSLVGLVAIYWTGAALGRRGIGLVACLLLASDPAYFHESHILQADAPSVAIGILAVAVAAMASRSAGPKRRLTLAVVAGLFIGLGMMLKLYDVVMIVPTAILLTTPLWKALAPGAILTRPLPRVPGATFREAIWMLVALAGGVVAAAGLVVLPFAASWSQFWQQAVQFHLAAEHAASQGLLFNIKLLIKDGQAYPLGILSVIAMIDAWNRRSWLILPSVLWLLVSVLLLLGQQPLFEHHLVLLSPPLALTGSFLLGRGWLKVTPADRKVLTRIPRVVMIVATVCVIVSLSLTMRDLQGANQPVTSTDAQMALALQGQTLRSDLVVTDDQYVAGLADRSVPPALVDTSTVRIESGYLTAAQLESIITRDDVRAILFASGRFNQIPGFRAWVASQFTSVATFGPGQTLYIKLAAGPPLA